MREEIRRLLEEAKERSTCRSARIAALIETPSGERVVGWNGPPGRAGAHARCLAGGALTPATMRDCPGVHAEVRAICRAAEAGIAVGGGTLYLSEWFPCAPCAVTMIEAGIVRLVVAKKIDYAKDDCYNFGLARLYLGLAGVVVEEWTGGDGTG
jgi:dCMP deaminase